MRHLLLSFTLLFGAATASAQQNTVLLLGKFNGGNDVTTDNRYHTKRINTNQHVTTGVGYQFSRHFTVGVQGSFSHSNSHQQRVVALPKDVTRIGIAAGAFGRYTAYVGDRFFVYLNGYAGQSASRQTDPVRTRWSRVTGADISPAVGVFIYRHWALNLDIGTVSYRYTHTTSGKHGALTYNMGNSFTLGISKNFGADRKPRVQAEK